MMKRLINVVFIFLLQFGYAQVVLDADGRLGRHWGRSDWRPASSVGPRQSDRRDLDARITGVDVDHCVGALGRLSDDRNTGRTTVAIRRRPNGSDWRGVL